MCLKTGCRLALWSSNRRLNSCHCKPEDDEEEYQGCFEGAEVIDAGAEVEPKQKYVDEMQRGCTYEEFRQAELRVAEEERAYIIEHVRALYKMYPGLIYY